MTSPLRSLVESGTKLWLDSVDPDLIQANLPHGCTGATSNPIIISDLIKTGRFDDKLESFLSDGLDDEAIAWAMTDHFVSEAQRVFLPVWQRTKGNDGYVSFELDPLLEDRERDMPIAERTRQYVVLGSRWAEGHENRMMKVPATEAGLAALEELAAAGLTLNVTLVFTQRQYELARDAIWRGRQRFGQLDRFKSVYSIFVSRVDVYTQKRVPSLSDAAQGQVGILNAKRIWKQNESFWKDKGLALEQEIIFASTGTKLESDPPDKYVEAFAGDDIETNPPETNEKVQALGKTYSRRVDQFPAAEVVREIDEKVDWSDLEATLMDEGTRKFAEPHQGLLDLIAAKRKELASVR